MSSARIYLEKLLAKGKLEAALEAGMLLCRHYQDSEGNAIVVQHSGQFHNLMDDYHAGTLSTDDFRPERARISRAMLEWVHGIPADWTTDPLQANGFSEKAFDQEKAANTGKSWWIPMLIVLGITVLLTLWLLRMRSMEDTQLPSPSDSSKPTYIPPADTTPRKPAPQNPSPQTSLPKSKSLPKPPPNSTTNTGPETKEVVPETKPSGTVLPAAQKFRSFAKTAIYDDMELGYMGDKYAFRNVRTKEILCCYAAAKGFSGGMAYVSLDGRNFFYINKKGDRVK